MLRIYVKNQLDGQAFHTAFMKVAIGIEKNTPQNPNILPKMNTEKIITTG